MVYKERFDWLYYLATKFNRGQVSLLPVTFDVYYKLKVSF